MLAKIAIERLIYAIDKPYSYRVPAGLELRPGMRVAVPFGRGNRTAEGMVLALEPGDDPDLKEVLRALDPEPVLTDRMLRLAAFVRERYFCTFYDALRVMLPAGLWLKSKERWMLAELPEDWRDRLDRDPEARRILTVLSDAGGSLDRETLLRQSGDREQTLDTLTAFYQIPPEPDAEPEEP